MSSERASAPVPRRSIRRYFNSEAVQATLFLVISTVSTKWVFFVYVATPTPAKAASAGAFLCISYIGWRKRQTIDRWWRRRTTRQRCAVCLARRPLYWARMGWFLAAACSLLAIIFNSCLEKRLEQAKRPMVVQCALPAPFYCQGQSEALCDLNTLALWDEQVPIPQGRMEPHAVRTEQEEEEEEEKKKGEQEEGQKEEEAEFGGGKGWFRIHTKTPIEKKKSKSFREAFLEELGDPLDWAWY